MQSVSVTGYLGSEEIDVRPQEDWYYQHELKRNYVVNSSREEEDSSNFFDGNTKLDVLRVESFTTWIQNNRGVYARIEVVNNNYYRKIF